MPEDPRKETYKLRDRLKRVVSPYGRSIDRARAMYLLEPPYVVREHKAPVIHLINDLAVAMGLVFGEIRMVGSAYLGMSLHKNTLFTQKGSDIDLAVVSEPRYCNLLRAAYEATKGYSDLTGFAPEHAEIFKQSTLLGYIDPLTLPKCDERDLWKNVLEQLTERYEDHFREVTAMVYCGPWFLEQKTATYIDKNLYGNHK